MCITNYSQHNFIYETGKHFVVLLLYPIYILSVECKILEARDIVLFTTLSPALTTTTQHIVEDQNCSRTDEYTHTYIHKVEMNFFSDNYPDVRQ